MKTYLYGLIVSFFLVACSGSGSSGDINTPTNNTSNVSEIPAEIDDSIDDSIVERSLSVPLLENISNITIASSYFMFKENAPDNEELIPYLHGSIDGHYIDEVTDYAISFNIKIPDDNVTYGSDAGKTIKYVGILFYPTQNNSSYVNPQTLGSWDLPSSYSQMEENLDSTPVFANKSEKYPLIVYSHGHGGDVISAGRQMHTFSTHGYAVLGLFHGDGRFLPYEGDVYSPQELTLRPLAISKAIDMLESSKYNTNIDFDKIGAFGNSLGGATTLMLVGAKPIDKNSLVGGILNNSINDSRIKVAAGIEPYMGDIEFPEVMGKLVSLFGWDSVGAKTIARPYLAITGTNDDVAVEKYTQAVLAQTQANSHIVSMEGESHEMSAEGSKTADTWAFHFINYYLKGDDTFLTMKDVEGDPVDTYSSAY